MELINYLLQACLQAAAIQSTVDPSAGGNENAKQEASQSALSSLRLKKAVDAYTFPAKTIAKRAVLQTFLGILDQEKEYPVMF